MNHKKEGIAAMIVAAFIAFSRMYLFVHFPTDILGGIILGVGVAVIVYFIVHNWAPKVIARTRKK